MEERSRYFISGSSKVLRSVQRPISVALMLLCLRTNLQSPKTRLSMAALERAGFPTALRRDRLALGKFGSPIVQLPLGVRISSAITTGRAQQAHQPRGLGKLGGRLIIPLDSHSATTSKARKSFSEYFPFECWRSRPCPGTGLLLSRKWDGLRFLCWRVARHLILNNRQGVPVLPVHPRVTRHFRNPRRRHFPSCRSF